MLRDQGLLSTVASKEKSRLDGWFPGQMVMKRNPKPSPIGTDFWSGTRLVDSVSGNSSMRIELPDGQGTSVNHGVDRWMTTLEKYSAGLGYLNFILNELGQSKGRYRRPQLDDFPTAYAAA